jgi:hypothetical protein
MNIIKAVITDDGQFSRWVGSELVNAIDSHNPHTVMYLLRNRKTLTTTIILGKPEDTAVRFYVEALGEEGRCPVAFFEVNKECFEYIEDQSEQETLNQLAQLIDDHYFRVYREEDFESEQESMQEQAKMADKSEIDNKPELDKSIN